MTFNAPRAFEIADRFRARGKTVVVGGYHPSLVPDEAHSTRIASASARPKARCRK